MNAESLFELPLMESVLNCRTEGELRDQITAYVHSFGLSTWVYVAKPDWPEASPYVLSSFPSSWIAPHPESLDAESDFAIARCRDTTAPFVWTDQLVRKKLASVCPPFFRPPSDFGLCAGINVPVHGLGCQWSVLSVATSGHLRNGQALQHQISGAVLLAVLTHQATHNLALQSNREPSQHLTPREVECLHWAALGKTGWEISQLLGITPRTVAFHMENAAHKLGVFGQRQAIARAIALHLIDL